MRHFICLVLSSTLFVWTGSAFAAPIQMTGFDAGNAGDIYAAEFILSARDVAQRLDRLSTQNNAPVYDTTKLRSMIDITKVDSQPHISLKDGDSNYEKIAINFYPTANRIVVNQFLWRPLRSPTQTSQRLGIVLHEYLTLSGEPDLFYKVSGPLIQMINPGNYSPDTWWNPVNPINFVIPTLEYIPANCSIAPSVVNPKNSAETITLETKGDCQDAYRKVVITKSAAVLPPSSQAHGLFHRFLITVFDNHNLQIDQCGYIPPWNTAPLDSPSTTFRSGQIQCVTAGVNLDFRYLTK